MERPDRHDHLSLAEAAAQLGLHPFQVWAEYRALGGTLAYPEIHAVVDPGHDLPDREHDLLATALNEHFLDEGRNHPVHYRRRGTDNRS